MYKTSEKFWLTFIYSALTLTTFAVFWQVHRFEFINYDDDKYVSENGYILSGLTIKNVAWVFTHEHGCNWHPLTGLSHMLDCQLFDLNAGRHHLVNLFFHIANVLLLFTVFRQMTGVLWPSAFVAAAFAVHPLHIESVAWISERKDVLSTLFWILTIAAYFRYTKNPTAGRYILTIVLITLGLLSKPMLVTLPFVLLLLDYWPLNRLDIKEKKSLYHLAKEKIPFFVLSAISCVITVIVQSKSGALRDIEQYHLSVRVSNAIVSYIVYIVKLFVPVNLAVFYPHPGNSIPLWQIVGATVLLAIITFLVLRTCGKYRYLLTGWLWYMGTLVPVIGLFQVGEQSRADRYTYVPYIGLFIIIAWAAHDLLAGWKYRKVVLSLSAVAIISVLSVCTWMQTKYWCDSRSLFAHTVTVTNGNYLAYNNLGAALIVQDKFDEAIDPLKNAIKLRPHYADALKNLGIAYGKLGRSQEEKDAYAQAIKTYRQVIKNNPNAASVHVGMGEIFSSLGRLEEAADHLRKALKIEPLNPEAHCKLGVVLGQQGKFDDALAQFEEALRIKPDFAVAYYNLSVTQGSLEHYQDVVEACRQAIKCKPNYPEAYFNLGVAYLCLNRAADAGEAFRQAVKIKPDFADAHYNLGMFYLKTGDGNAALDEYEILKKLDIKKADALLARFPK